MFVARPNVRAWFIPDPGYTIFDADLKQADAQVVAWEADDEELKAIFRDPTADLHSENCKTIFGKFTKHGRQVAKAGVHATNYGASAKTMARHLGITVKMAETFQRRWFAAHPKIKQWHERIEMQLQTTRTVANAFGYKRRFFERVEGILPEALAWIPQSTVAKVINEGLVAIDEHPELTALLQVHDSVIGQFPDEFYPRREIIRELMTIRVPYDDPMYIGVDVKCSRKSWGECKEVPWTDDYAYCPH